MNPTDVTIISTYATDRLYDEAGNWICDQQGGPCLFIVEAMQDQKIIYDTLAPAEKALVDIRIVKGDEFGTIAFAPNFDIDWSSIISPYILISTVFDEVSLSKIDMYKGNVCLDVQGFVRKTKADGKPIWEIHQALYQNCFCLKATEAELKYMPSTFVEKQKQKLLLITKGSHGIDYWEEGEHKELLLNEIIECPDTIGAGDTFFASVVAGFSRNESTDMAIKNAFRTTAAFLKKKSHQAQCKLTH